MSTKKGKESSPTVAFFILEMADSFQKIYEKEKGKHGLNDTQDLIRILSTFIGAYE